MQSIESFDIKLFDLPKERFMNLPEAQCKLYLNDTHVALYIHCDSEELVEDSMIWEERLTSQTSVYPRHLLTAVHYFYINKGGYWELQLEFNGVQYSVSIYFETYEAGHPAYSACKKYLLGQI